MGVPPARYLVRGKDLADSRYADQLTVADMARAARLSSAHFSREFRRAFGESPHQYLLTRRLERAAYLLRNTDRTVTDICFSVGLRSVGSFTTSFRRMFGMTPTQYRASFPPARAYAVVPACVVRVGYLYGPQSADLRAYRTAFRLGRPYWSGPAKALQYHLHQFDAAAMQHPRLLLASIEAERHGATCVPAPDTTGNAMDFDLVLRDVRLPDSKPDQPTTDAFVAGLAAELDRAAELHPNPGRTDTFRRLNRTEYANAIRDLLELEVDATKFLPPDDSTRGFDNIAGALTMSPALMEAYLSAAGKISRLAMGRPGRAPGGGGTTCTANGCAG
jgi:AraC-like DNA-binding protein